MSSLPPDPAAAWRKSSYSTSAGGECIEVAAAWRSSTYSSSAGGECVEVADAHPDLVPVRDSKDPHGPALLFAADAWSAFIRAVRAGGFPPS